MRESVSILPLRLRGVSFSAGGRALLGPLDLEFPAGGLTAVIGPNGAGKSLLLRLCHGLLTPASGTVEWSHGAGVREGRKRHAMVFQKPVMLRRSVSANIEHALATSGLPRAQAGERLSAALIRFGLLDIATRPARVLSGGEQQRLAIARAWARDPDAMFLDEPTAHLDPGATRQIEDMLHALMGEGVTLVMATHDLGQARRLASRVVFLNKGALAEAGDAPAFFDAPESHEARAFINGELLW